MKLSILYNTIRPGGVDILYNDLIKQTFKNFEVVFVDGWAGEREAEVREYLKDFPLTYLKGLPKRENDVWTLNKDYNLGLSYCAGELVIFLQDYLWIPGDSLERFYQHYLSDKNAIVTGVGHKAMYPNSAHDLNGKLTIFKEECFEKPTGVSEIDFRVNDGDGVDEVEYSRWEMNLASAPKKVLDKIGGFEEDMDEHYGGDNVVLGAKAYKAGSRILCDKGIVSVGFNQSAFFPRPEKWEEKHVNKGFLSEKLCQIMS